MRASVAALTVAVLCALPSAAAETAVWQPAPGHEQIPLWPGKPPGTRTPTEPEKAGPVDTPVAGKPWTYVTNVSKPTLTVYAPTGKSTGAAVVVFPGGGYQVLAIDLEGTEACDWLTSKGVTCILLKYRVPHKGEGWNQMRGIFVDTGTSMALQDAQRALGLVRFHAAEWHIDRHKVGVLGFSAGGHMVAAVSTQFAKRVYPVVDGADRESCRPDFAIALYPGHLLKERGTLALNPDLPVTAETPPTFLVQAENDRVDSVDDSLAYYAALRKAGVAVELHLYAEGGHAFGLRRTKDPITAWPDLAETWLHAIAVISP